MAIRTIREHVAATASRVISGSGSDFMAPRRERLFRMLFDGRPLGEHGLPADATKEERKRLDEMLALGHVLVGADVDHEIDAVFSIAPRGHVPTADFEAVLRRGGRAKIELCRLTDETEKQYINALSEIGRRAEEALSRGDGLDALIGSDTIYIRFYGGIPTARDVPAAAAELADIVANECPARRASTSMSEVGPQYPVLNRLGAHWARMVECSSARIMMDPLLHVVRPDLEASFDPMFAKKAKKVAQYADGCPVWLALYGDSGMTYPLGAVQAIAGREGFDPSPFERVIVGCFTAGVVFQNGAPPRYGSLSATG
ncbi:MAG: hypothetical protein JWM87_3958 [Candidatus Eremiobacteraeota bacterium]|nr:hypothetical protein [Candidatus Eremiobacteraeota bacterium]